jgi:hypothetical protein
MKITVFWEAASCSLVETAPLMEAVSTSEMSANFYEITGRNIPAGSHLYTSVVPVGLSTYF